MKKQKLPYQRTLSNPDQRHESSDENLRTHHKPWKRKTSPKIPQILGLQQNCPKHRVKSANSLNTSVHWHSQHLSNTYVVKICELYQELNFNKQSMKKWRWDESRWEEEFQITICLDWRMPKRLVNTLKSSLKKWKRLKVTIESSEITSTILFQWTFHQETECKSLILLRNCTQYLIWFLKLCLSQFKPSIGFWECTKINCKTSKTCNELLLLRF